MNSEKKPEIPGLRDELARERTVLANERTFLSYLRTAIMLAVSGITIFKLLGNDILYSVSGILLIVLAIVTFVVGFYRFRLFAGRIGERIRTVPDIGKKH